MDFFACLVLCLFVMASFTSVQAEYCGTRNGYQWYCNNGQYCCGFRGSTALCCTYTPFYTWWYFWFGIAIFLFFVTAIVACCRRQRMRRQLQASTTARIRPGAIVQGQQQPADFVNPIAPRTAEAPPMYPAVAPAYQNSSFEFPPAYNSHNYYPETGKDVKENLNNVQ